MADSAKGWLFTLSNEDTVPPSGKVVFEPNGGMARLGLNSKAHPEAVKAGFYTMSTPDALRYANQVYVDDYWRIVCGDQLISQLIASKWADLAFNASPHAATLIVQRALSDLGPHVPPLVVDGMAGDHTIAVVNTYLDDEKEEQLYGAIVSHAVGFYKELHILHPEKFSAALEESWIKRANKRPFSY